VTEPTTPPVITQQTKPPLDQVPGIQRESFFCEDGIDNDLDGLTDSADSDCPQREENCEDGIDNDLDGNADSEDTDCFEELGGPEPEPSEDDEPPSDLPDIPEEEQMVPVPEEQPTEEEEQE
jgi:hypothetical protein